MVAFTMLEVQTRYLSIYLKSYLQSTQTWSFCMLFLHGNIFFVAIVTQIQTPTVSMAQLRSPWISDTPTVIQMTVRPP